MVYVWSTSIRLASCRMHTQIAGEVKYKLQVVPAKVGITGPVGTACQLLYQLRTTATDGRTQLGK